MRCTCALAGAVLTYDLTNSAQRGSNKPSSLDAHDAITVFDFHLGHGTCLIGVHYLKVEVTKGESAGPSPAQSNQDPTGQDRP